MSPAQPFDPGIVAQVAEKAPDGVVVVDRHGTIEYWNHGMTRIFGFEPAEVLGGPLSVIIPERLRKRHDGAFDAAVARGTSRYGDDDLLAVPAVAKGGRSLSIEFSIVLLPAGDDASATDSTDDGGDATGGGIVHVAAVIRDVTERWQQDRELKRRVRELEAAQPGANTVSTAP